MEMILEGGHVDLQELEAALRSDLNKKLSPADVINIVEVVDAFQGSKISPELISKIMLMQKAVESDIASPELSSIPPRLLNVTPYQNIENGIAYIPSQATTSSGLAVANLSRFNVSPPNSNSRPARTKLKTKTVSWVSDRKLKAKHISDD